MLSKVFIDDLKALKTGIFGMVLFCLHSCTKKCIDFFLISDNGDFKALNFFLSVDFISGLIATTFLGLLNHKLVSSETFSGIFLVINVKIKTKTHDLVSAGRFVRFSKSVVSFWKLRFLGVVKIPFLQKGQLFECFSMWCT